MKSILNINLICLMLLLALPLMQANPESENDASTTKGTPTKTKDEIMKSVICSKCKCDVDNSLIDCTDKLTEWFNATEWKILQEGEITFETIKMDHNNFTTVPVFPTYGVKNLYLANNQIESIEIGAFQNLTQLTRLDLSNNKLKAKALVPDVFKGPFSVNDFEPLKNLKAINLGYNLLHFLDDDLFEHVPNLEELILCSNTIQVINKMTETALSGMLSLKILDISYTEINALPDTIFHGPQDLDTLIISGNLFTKVPKALSYAKNLKRLVFDENPIASLEGENVFPALPNLTYLSIAYMPELSKIGPGALSELQNLQELILSDNKMLAEIDNLALAKNITGDQFFDYPPLQKLYLSNCNLTVLPESLIIRWDKLSALDLRYNPWNCDESNSYMINYVIQQVKKTSPILVEDVTCAYPQELKDIEVLKVAEQKLMGSSSGGSLVWISLLICVVLAIPMGFVGFVLYRRGVCGMRRKNEAARRALYNRTSFNEDFHI